MGQIRFGGHGRNDALSGWRLRNFADDGRTTWHVGPDRIQRNLERFLAYYNAERSHQGYRLKGRTPAEALARRATTSNYLSWVG